MKRTTDPLLDDLLDETAPSNFRATVLAETLRHARRRKQARRLNAILAAIAVVGLLTFSMWNPPQNKTAVRPDSTSRLKIVESRPLNPGQVVITKAGSVRTVDSLDTTVAIVETDPSRRNFDEINDQQLLALAAGRPIAFLHPGSDREELILLNPADRNGFVIR
ncbi:MAG TPA: hypothetical protein VFW05_17225 [Verrucomicrobiae bacterium]|jgi:hypothetical protein|nr:hypothetical protein [Verrucomicrobiae bacterium]